MHPEQKIPHPGLKRIMIIAGEASGDLHGSNLVKAMRDIMPDLYFYGIGGQKLRKAGVEILVDSSDMAVIGLTEVLSRIGFILRTGRRLKESLKKERPDLLILIDYPDFNLPLAREAKKNGVKVFYYISPQVWAWRKRRIYSIARCVDRMAVILPFEVSVYDKVDLDVNFVGHPLLDVVKRRYSDDEALEKFNLGAGVKTVALLPGSRKSEVKKLLPDMLKAAEILKRRLSSVQFVLPLADTLDRSFVSDIVEGCNADVEIVSDDTYDVIGVSDIAIVASGTATLETALLETPMIIVYKISLISYLVGRMIIDVKHIGLVNIIAEKTVVPELIQNDASPENMADKVCGILENEEIMSRTIRDLKEIRGKMGDLGASGRAAELACEMIRQAGDR